MRNDETKAMQQGFFTYGFSSLLFLRAEEKAVLTVCTVDFSSKSFQFLVTKKFVLPTKSKNLGASWPQGFFSKVEPWYIKLDWYIKQK